MIYATQEHVMKVNPYLTFDGDCEEAFKVYEKVLGGKIIAMMTHRDTPAEAHVSAEWRDKILHAAPCLRRRSRCDGTLGRHPFG